MKTVYVLQDQSFWQLALPVFLASLSAFALSVMAFLIRNNINSRNRTRLLLSNLNRELRYDLEVIQEIKKDIDKTIVQILSDKEIIYAPFKYYKVLNTFVLEAYREGVLFNLLSEYELAVFDDTITHYMPKGPNNFTQETWLNGRLTELKEKKLLKMML